MPPPSVDKQLAALDPLTRAALTQRQDMTADEAEAIVRRRWSHDPCDLRVGWQVMRSREARQPLMAMPPMRLPGPVTREAHDFDEECRARASEVSRVAFTGIEKILAARRASGAT